MDTPRTFSLNLMAYVALRTNLTPEIKLDENNVAYAVFPQCQGVTYAIRDFRRDRCTVEIHSFLSAYKQIKEIIKQLKAPQNAGV